MLKQREFSLSLLLAGIAAAFLFRLWAYPGILYSPHSDLIAQGAGLRALESRTLFGETRWPVWDPSCNSGSPAHANPLTAYSSPFNWLFWVLPLDRAANLNFVLSVILAGLSMFVCARRFLKNIGAAFFCGVSYMLSYRYLALIDAGWLPTILMYAYAPLLAWSAERLIARPNAARAAAFSAVLALSAMQGSAQSFYYALLGLIVLIAWLLRDLPRARRKSALIWLLTGATLALMLAAPDILPRAQFTALSTRRNFNYRFFLGSPPAWSSLTTFFDPRDAGGTRFEYWENNFYFGLWLYPLAAWACLRDWKKSRPLAIAFAVIIALCFDSPLLKLLFRFFPGFALFRLSPRLLQLAQLVAVLLAGIGVDSLFQGPWRRRKLMAGIFLCALPIADSGLRMLPRLRSKPLDEAFPAPAFFETLKRSPDSGRVAALGRTAVPYGAAAYYGIDMINGYAPLNLRHYVEYFSILENGDPARTPQSPVVWTDLTSVAKPEMLRALDVESIVGNSPAPLDKIGYEFVGRRDDVPVFSFYHGMVRVPVYLWRDRRPLGPAYFASSLDFVSDEAASLAAIAGSGSAREAHVFGQSASGNPSVDFAGGQARMTRRGENIYEYAIDSRGKKFLILSQIWYPGWRATLDGVEIPLFRTNHALLGCFVPRGAHSLRLEMKSPALNLGLALCATGLLILGFLIAREAVFERRRLA